jgi:hypothetical protein
MKQSSVLDTSRLLPLFRTQHVDSRRTLTIATLLRFFPFFLPGPRLQELRAGLELNFALNSKAFLIEHASDLVEFVGNRTECALLMLGRKWGADYKQLREQHQPNVAHVSCCACAPAAITMVCLS